MPIYEYRCRSCGAETEKLQRLGAADLTECPACRKPGLERTVSAAGFRLKGGGWYETDFKSSSKKNVAGDSEAKPASAEKTEKTEKAAPAAAASDQGKSATSPKPTTGSGASAA